MKTYMICNTFKGPARSYVGLFEKMRTIGAVSAIGGTWLINTLQSSEELQNALFSLLQPSDQMFIFEVQSNWAAMGISDIIKSVLPG